MEKSYLKLLNGNKAFAAERSFDDPNFFKNLSLKQTPEYLWIGCSDSRVPANEITKTHSGEIFVHRNIANLVVHTDLNLLSVVQYAVEHLKVKHIIVCGHYGCGGIKAAMSNDNFGLVDNWLRNIKDVYDKHQEELDLINDLDKRTDRLTELNVIEQVKNLAKTKIIQEAWQKRQLFVHGWVYGMNNGLITDLNVLHEDLRDLKGIYRYNAL